MSETTNESALRKLARDTAGQLSAQSDNVLWRVAEYVPGLNRLVARRERSLGMQQCKVMLEICRALQKEQPSLAGEALYLQVVKRRLSCDDARAREIVRLADQSFAQWPEERDVNFRDVVNYVIVNQIMSAHTRAMGTLIDMEGICADALPAGL